MGPCPPGGEPSLRPVRRAHPDRDQPRGPQPRGVGQGRHRDQRRLRDAARRPGALQPTARRSICTGSGALRRRDRARCRSRTASSACGWNAPSAIAIRTTSGSRTICSASPTSSCTCARPASRATTRRSSPRWRLTSKRWTPRQEADRAGQEAARRARQGSSMPPPSKTKTKEAQAALGEVPAGGRGPGAAQQAVAGSRPAADARGGAPSAAGKAILASVTSPLGTQESRQLPPARRYAASHDRAGPGPACAGGRLDAPAGQSDSSPGRSSTASGRITSAAASSIRPTTSRRSTRRRIRNCWPSCAREFIRHGYDLKWLHRTILSSRTYQQSSQANRRQRRRPRQLRLLLLPPAARRGAGRCRSTRRPARPTTWT